MADDPQDLIELVRAVRHDANGPLTAALGNVQMLLEDPAIEDAEVLASLREVEHELRRVSRIILRLASFERGEGTIG